MTPRTLPPIDWDPATPSYRAQLAPAGVRVQPPVIPGLLVIERSDPDVWVEWRRVCAIQERRAARACETSGFHQ